MENNLYDYVLKKRTIQNKGIGRWGSEEIWELKIRQISKISVMVDRDGLRINIR